MRLFYRLLIVVLLITQVSCDVINPDEDVPGYLIINDFNLETNFGLEGSNSHNITELWIYADGKYIGAYDLPAEIPVLEAGVTDITILPGIRKNGISATRVTYPYYTQYATNVDFVPGQDVIVTPDFGYKENLTFWMENFDDPGIKLSASTNSDTTLEVTNNAALVFEGSGSGMIHLTSDTAYFFARTEEGIDLPSGRQIFCEIDYKCDNSFAVGLESYSQGSVDRAAALVILPSTNDNGVAEWNKIYVELSYIAGNFPNADFFTFYIESYIDGGKTASEIYIDNIKIVHFE